MSVGKLFTPFKLRNLELPNRIVMAPMTRSQSPGGVVTPEVASYYARRAAADVGLIVTEGTGIDRPSSLNDPNVPRFHGETELAAWKTVVDAVHAAGGKIAPQLWHVGSARNRNAGWTAPPPVDAPSGLSQPGKKFTEPMTEEAIIDTIEAFGRAAGDAKRIGFDAVELHGAHGYLIDQFLWAGTNERTDKWGGAALPERSRFAVEIVKAVRAAVGPEFPVILRLSQWKQQDYAARLALTPDEMAAWLNPLAEAGVDSFHCSQRRFWEPEFEGSNLNFAGWAKKLTGKPTITVGSVGLSGEFTASFGGEGSKPASLDELVKRLDADEFDLVGVGRAILADPNWATKIKEGRTSELADFDARTLAVLT
jgi:2,4-dienoyl-CoA reductase-like NADH-dependent reductase (Old Yellow Enzyme family)